MSDEDPGKSGCLFFCLLALLAGAGMIVLALSGPDGPLPGLEASAPTKAGTPVELGALPTVQAEATTTTTAPPVTTSSSAPTRSGGSSSGGGPSSGGGGGG